MNTIYDFLFNANYLNDLLLSVLYMDVLFNTDITTKDNNCFSQLLETSEASM
jgi:hypothetical protein